MGALNTFLNLGIWKGISLCCVEMYAYEVSA